MTEKKGRPSKYFVVAFTFLGFGLGCCYMGIITASNEQYFLAAVIGALVGIGGGSFSLKQDNDIRELKDD